MTRKKVNVHPKKERRGTILKNALLVATFDDAMTAIPGGSVVVEGREIAWVGKAVPPRFHPSRGYRVLDAAGCLVIPGLVNTHHHLFQVLTRALPRAQNEPLFNWLTCLYDVWANVTADAVHASALAGLGELLLTGCTTSADHLYLFPAGAPADFIDGEVAAAREAGIRFHLCHGSMSLGRSNGGLPPDALVQDEESILRESERLIAAYHDPSRFSRCRVALAPCAPFNVTASLLRDTAALARRNGVRLHTHLAETLDEERFCLATYRKRPLDYLEELGWLGPDVWFAHGIHLTDGEIRRMGARGAGLAHCPTSNLRLGSGIAPVRKLLDAGVPVGLGVDGSSSNDSSDILGELRQCLLVHRIASGPPFLTARDVFRLATRGGARLLGRDDIGSLEPGKAADIALFDLDRLGYAGALHDPLAALLLCGDSHIARTVLVDGEVVVDDGKLVNVDEKKVTGRVNRWSKKILEKKEHAL